MVLADVLDPPSNAPAPAAPARARTHIVDVLIAERAPRLTGSATWPLVRPLLYAVLGYPAARRMADSIAPLPGQAALDHVSDLLNLQTEALCLDRLPRTGRCIVVCNHPTGIADGVAVYDAIRRVRTDAIFFANADALRVSPGLAETLIPVEWVVEKRTREKTRATLDAARAAFEAERCVVMFPAGRLARVAKDGSLTDPDWAPTAASMARKYGAPVVPIHVEGPYSRLFHLFDRFSRELRDVTLFHELLNKRGKPFRLKVGKPVDPSRLDIDATRATYALKAFTERVLPSQPDAEFA
jgi:putative hemolysin